jgi:hypothetical protein
VVNLVALIVAPLVVTAAQNPDSRVVVIIVMFVLLAIIGWAIMTSKRSDPETEKMVETVAKSGAD